jgi:precorrin-2 dehydrogenase/sirohydrochlorin ferrochelatase
MLECRIAKKVFLFRQEEMNMEVHHEAAVPAVSSQEKLYPAFLIMRDKACVVVGGGRVATRKVRVLLSAKALVTVISPVLHPELQALHTEQLIRYVPGEYAIEYLACARLVFAATDNADVNARVALDARRLGLWVNVADNPALSDFYVPATIHRQHLTLAISTAGESPAFARYVRELLENALSEALGQTLEMVAEARPLVLAEPEERQKDLWNSLLALRLETIVESEGYAAARTRFTEWLACNISTSRDDTKPSL